MSIGLIQQPEEVFQRLEIEAQKYQDVSTIFRKLQQQGSIQQIYQIFQQIFQNEHDFTISELTKLAVQQQKVQSGRGKFDFCEHYKMNSQIFKSNLNLISQIVIEDIWMFYNMTIMASINENSQDSLSQQKQNDSLSNATGNENIVIQQSNVNQGENLQQQQQLQMEQTPEEGENQDYYSQNQLLQQQQQQQLNQGFNNMLIMQQNEKANQVQYNEQRDQQNNDIMADQDLQQQGEQQLFQNNSELDQNQQQQYLQENKASMVIEKMNLQNLNKNLAHIINYHPSLDFQMPLSNENQGTNTNYNSNSDHKDASVKIADRYQILDNFKQQNQQKNSFTNKPMSPQTAFEQSSSGKIASIDQYFQKINNFRYSPTNTNKSTQINYQQQQDSISQFRHANNNSVSLRKSNVLSNNNDSQFQQPQQQQNSTHSVGLQTTSSQKNLIQKSIPIDYSEFTYNQKANKFAVSQRKLTQPNNPHSPGPCAYNIKKDLLEKRTTGGTIPRSQKISIFDQQCLSNRICDRMYYPSEHAIYKPMKKQN